MVLLGVGERLCGAGFGAASTSRRSCSRGTGAGAWPTAPASWATSARAGELGLDGRELVVGRAGRRLREALEPAVEPVDPSSIPSNRCETERNRRVSRSMSAADGMLSAPRAVSWACTARSRA